MKTGDDPMTTVRDALERAVEPIDDRARADVRRRVMGTIRRDSRTHYFATLAHRVAATAAALGMLGVGVAYAANSALPGDVLYDLKRGAENALIAILPPGAVERSLLVGVAARRAGEAADLANAGAATYLVDDTLSDLRAAVNAARANGESLATREAQHIEEQAQDAPAQTREAISDAVTAPNETPGGTLKPGPPAPDSTGEGGTAPGDDNPSGDGSQQGGNTQSGSETQVQPEDMTGSSGPR